MQEKEMRYNEMLLLHTGQWKTLFAAQKNKIAAILHIHGSLHI